MAWLSYLRLAINGKSKIEGSAHNDQHELSWTVDANSGLNGELYDG
jgi:hypothetical protein